MGTETKYSFEHSHNSPSLVKLNNPQMGTETSVQDFHEYIRFHFC